MKFRLLCFGSHLLASAFIAILSVYVVFWLWYPSPLDKALGVASIFLLLLCIDVIVGPLLTLLVAKQGKRTLKMDLLTIAALQLAALVYGLYAVAQGRPVWLVYDASQFELVQAFEALKPEGAEASAMVPIGLRGPVWGVVAGNVPASIAKGEAYYQAAFLQPFDDAVAAKVARGALPLELLKRFNDAASVDSALSLYPDANAFVPLVAREKSLSVLVNTQSGHPIAIVDLSPW